MAWSAITALAGLLAAAEPADAESLKWLAIPALTGFALAAISGGRLAAVSRDVDDLPARSVLPMLAVTAGIGLGSLVAAITTGNLAVRIIAAVVAVAAIGFAMLRARLLRGEVIDVRAERERIAQLKTRGRRVRARVVEAEHPGVLVDALLLFHIAADYDDGRGTYRVEERMLLPINDAPVVGGTVLLWVDPTGDDPWDVFMEADPDSIRHPDPSMFVPQPAPESGGMGGSA